jgi:hypothetical protein
MEAGEEVVQSPSRMKNQPSAAPERAAGLALVHLFALGREPTPDWDRTL